VFSIIPIGVNELACGLNAGYPNMPARVAFVIRQGNII